jgi:prepilin-type N-terminal cleavage/methylation domain-containing protein
VRSQPLRGFTLIEMLIVIGIMALISSLVLGTITRMGASNRRVTCQSNLAQIYQSCRLYQQDEGSFPFYYDTGYRSGHAALSLEPNLGLWALYAFPKAGNVNAADPKGPVGRYVRSSRVLHCPQDNLLGVPTLLTADGNSFNNGYLSYQRVDAFDAQPSYQSIRTTTAADTNWKRQLVTFNGTTRVFRSPADDTIVTWCSFHRTAVGGRNYDNVLFYDGSVQLISRQTDAGDTGWQRLPKPPS